MPGFWECVDGNGDKLSVHEQDLKQMEIIPSRFKRHLFLGVAHALGTVIANCPNATEIDPSPLSAETYSRRLREAIEAKVRYKYTHSGIDELAFNTWHDQVAFAIANGKILAGPREAIKTTRAVGKVKSTLEAALEAPEVVVHAAHLDALCSLLHERAFKPAPNFIVYNLDQPTIDTLQSRYDIAIVPFEDDKTKHKLIV